MKDYDIGKDGDDIVFKRVTKKGEKQVWLAHVRGVDAATRRPDLDFVEPHDGHFLGKGKGYMAKFVLTPEAIYMCGRKETEYENGFKRFFMVTTNGMPVELTRKQVYESFGIEWEDNYKPNGSIPY